MDAGQFRTDFPEFADATVYPDAQVNLWLNLGVKLLDPMRWCDLLDTGLELFIAHNLALGAPAQAAASKGGVPGQNSGPVSAKAVDKVSVSYDTGAGTLESGGHWNLTTYGTRFLQLARMVGAGGVQL